MDGHLSVSSNIDVHFVNVTYFLHTCLNMKTVKRNSRYGKSDTHRKKSQILCIITRKN